MNVTSFAQEFASMVIRYTEEPVKDFDSWNTNQPEPLTKDEVANIVINVLFTLLNISDIKVGDYSSKTADAEISVTTPTTPVVDKTDQKNEDAYRPESQDIQKTPQDLVSSSPDLRTDEIKETTTLEVFQEKKKFISRSSPAIYVTNIGRSDTFVLEENQLAQAIDLKTFNDPFVQAEITSGLLQSLNKARMAAMSVVAELDEIYKQAFSQSMSPRRLSMSDTGRKSSTTKSSVPIKVRRSISDFPRTPTSSKSSATGSQDTTDKRRSHGTASVDSASRKSSSTASVTRSISNIHLSSSSKSFDSSKLARNPKYAHVQSTIPKPISSKRKADK